MRFVFTFLLGMGLIGCLDEQVVIYCPAPECSQEATVVDYTGLDACGLVLELPNGRRLLPVRLTYIQPPTADQDPIYHYDLKAGEKVYISYNLSEAVTACMMGESVFITCIRPAAEE